MVNDLEWWEKYRDATLDLPSEQVESAKKLCMDESVKNRKQAEALKKMGRHEEAKKYEEKAGKYEEASKKICDSGVSSQEAIDARINPKRFVTKELIKDSHKAGVEAAKASAILSSAVSVGQNIYSVFFEDKTIDEAVENVVGTTLKAGVNSYATGVSGTALKAVMHSSSNTIIRRLSTTSAPMMIITGAAEITRSLSKYATGNITTLELMEELGEKGTGMVAAGVGATFGATGFFYN